MLNISIVWSEELYPHLDLVPHQGGELSKITNVAPGQYFPHWYVLTHITYQFNIGVPSFRFSQVYVYSRSISFFDLLTRSDSAYIGQLNYIIFIGISQ